MRYAVLIYGNEAAGMAMSEAEMQAEINAYNVFTESIMKSGVMDGGAPLLPTTSATTVRVRDGKTLTTDGPFAETKEQLGGFYVLKCDNLDQAIEFAARIPGAARGSIEVRPVMEYE